VIHSSFRDSTMTMSSWLTLLVVAGFVWGGFLFLLTLALRSEAGKGDGAPPG
jgi:hypothetical protein